MKKTERDLLLGLAKRMADRTEPSVLNAGVRAPPRTGREQPG
jgi:hypothetical protein